MIRRLTHHPRCLTLLYLTLIIPVGLYSKFYSGWGAQWLNHSFGGVLYEIGWCLVFFLIWPTYPAIGRIPVAVFSATCALEFLQLWHPPWLEAIRTTFLGRMILGTTFTPSDFIYYVVGSLLGGLLLQQIWQQTHPKRE